MVKLSSPCRAKDPATCHYHGYEVRASEFIDQGRYDEALNELQARDRTGVQRDDHDQNNPDSKDSPPATQAVDRVGVHTSHCCNIHGCKYNDESCPVETGTHPGEYPCEFCDMEVEAYTNRYGQMKTFYNGIQAIDPAGCGCTECITGMYVPEDQWRAAAKAGDLKNVLYLKVANNTGRSFTQLLEEGNYGRTDATHFQQILNGTAPSGYNYEEDIWGR